MGFFNDLTRNQKYALLMVGMLIVAGVILPLDVYTELLGFSQDFATRDEVWTAIEDYIDQGLGGSPYQTEKADTFQIGLLDVAGTIYAYYLDGVSGVLQDYSATHSDVWKWVNGNDTIGRIYVGKGTHQLTAVTLSARYYYYGEEGAVLNLTATPTLTITGDSYFENFNFTSVFDGAGHVVIESDVIFDNCDFALFVEMPEETNNGVMTSNAASPNSVEFRYCTLDGGRASPAKTRYFGLLRTATSMSRLIVKNFLVKDIRVNNMTSARGQIFKVLSGDTIDYADFKNIEFIQANITDDLNLLWVTGGLNYWKMDGLIFRGGIFNDSDSRFNIFSKSTGAAIGDIELSNINIYGQFHPVIFASTLKMDNIHLEGNGNIAAWDMGALATVDMRATASNLYLINASLEMNTGWQYLSVSNSMFISSRLYVLDEGTETQERVVLVDNCIWNSSDGGRFGSAIEVGYGGGVDLKLLHVSNTVFTGQSVDNPMNVLVLSGTPTSATRIILDHITVRPRLGSGQPRIITSGSRNNDNQEIWIFDSQIITNTLPLTNWNPVRINDRFENVKWIKTSDSSVYHSEFRNNATIASGTSSVTVTHNLPVRTAWTTIQVTPTTDLANCTQFWWDWASFTNTQFVIRVGAAGVEQNCDDDITFNWYADVQ